MILGAVLAFLTVVGLFLVSLRRPWVGAAIVLVLLPWDGVAVDLGVRLTVYRLALFGWGAAMLVRWVAGASFKPCLSRPRFSVWAWAFFAYAILWTLLQLFVVPEARVAGGTLRSVVELRSVTQIGWLVLRFLPLFLLSGALVHKGEVTRLVRLYLVSLTVLAALGWIQMAVWWTTGVDVTPVGAVESVFGGGQVLRHGMLPAFGRRILRMSSFGGEPKGLGQSLAVALLLLQGRVWLETTGRRGIALLWGFLFAAMITTFSTSALYVWGGGTVVLAGYLTLTRTAGSRGTVGYGLALLGLTGLLIAGTISILGVDPGAVQDLASARTVGRRIIPDFDTAVLRFLQDQPYWGVVGVGLGNVHAYATPYLPDFALDYAEGQIFVAKSGYLRLLSEIGLIGLALYVVWMWREIRLFGKSMSPLGVSEGGPVLPGGAAAFRSLAMALGFVMVLAFLARGYLWNEAVWSVAVLRSLRGVT